ncbi:predicted protein [Chaetoceros tenuissimus]|uniref:Uncharacterized protein n=1 Tax=Chaetoceros tenuissimus TaxID=426638 RepID=A0AAD3CW04_9STRA|nr:predicted protein [Chaetoceros tenuissimus]
MKGPLVSNYFVATLVGSSIFSATSFNTNYLIHSHQKRCNTQKQFSSTNLIHEKPTYRKSLDPYTPIGLQMIASNNDKEDKSENEQEKNDQAAPIQKTNIFEEIFDPIISSPYFATFLFWLPFLANDRLRNRVSNFLAQYLDLSIALPVFAIGSIVGVVYLSYQTRLMDIEYAQSTTEDALRQLREARAAQMSGSQAKEVLEMDYQRALENYEYVLKQELELRSFAGMKVNAPNAPGEREEDLQAITTLLNMKISEDGNLEMLD